MSLAPVTVCPMTGTDHNVLKFMSPETLSGRPNTSAYRLRPDSDPDVALPHPTGELMDPYDEVMAAPTAQEIVDWLTALGFESPSGAEKKWYKVFTAHSYVISVDTSTGEIDYGQQVTVHRRTVVNLRDRENLVVLECVSSLLVAGYRPELIELEKDFPLGRRAGGYLDVLVRTEEGDRTYLMVECKTYGAEYNSELTKLTTRPGSQLMSYVQQDRSVEHAILYASQVKDGVIERVYAGFATGALLGNNTNELFEAWDKETYNVGLFEAAPFSVEERSLRIKDLLDLTNEDGQRLFNMFREILRRHAVSDLPNAFNKLFNLFICKIRDEDKSNPDAITEFQWRGGESAITVLDRLAVLYEKGMRDFLRLDVSDSASVIDAAVADLSAEKKSEIRRVFAELRQYSNADFAFIDVFDRDSYDQNALIVRDMVRLLQNRRLRYTQKHGFMGLFFERLLNTSMKQESGQFFTPPPIAQFVNESLPIEQIVNRKILANDPHFLPYGIDYAAGSGHFLTEFMERVDQVLKSIDPSTLSSTAQKTNHASWKESLQWAGEFVYGVELDYRLAKTAKVSTFLHGDGLANVIRANGLGSFQHDADFAKVSRLNRNDSSKDNQIFDVVVANPPYSVAGFAQALPYGAESFDLWPFKGDRSDDIEAFFVERTKQILAPGGVAGIILPTSILTNEGMETRARAMLVEYFDIVALVSLGDRVFIATDTPCTIVFLRRRDNSAVERVRKQVDTYLSTGATPTVRGVADAFEQYARTFHDCDASTLQLAIDKVIGSDLPLLQGYEWMLGSRSRSPVVVPDENGVSIPTAKLRNYVINTERARMIAFFASLNESTLVVNAPRPRPEKIAFLGYSFSERRRREGIRFESGTDVISTPLFDPTNLENAEKISFLIRRKFSDSPVTVPTSLPWAEVHQTSALLGLDDPDFVWRVRTVPPGAADSFKVSTARLSTVCDVNIGATPPRDRPDHFRGTEMWVKISDMIGCTPSLTPVITTTSEKITETAAAPLKRIPKGTLLLSFKLSIGRTAIAGEDLFTNEAIASISVLPNPDAAGEWVDRDYLGVLLRRIGDRLLGLKSVGPTMFGQTLNLGKLRGLRVPVMSPQGRAAVMAIDSDSSKTDDQKRLALEDLIWE